VSVAGDVGEAAAPSRALHNRSRTVDRLLLVFAPALAILAPLVDTFGRLSIPILTWPSIRLLGQAAITGLALGAVAAILRPSRRGQWLRGLAFAGALTVVVLVVVDLAFSGHQLLTHVASGRTARLAVLAVGTAIVFGILCAIRAHAARILFVLAAVFLASTVWTRAGAFVRPSREARPPTLAAAPTNQSPFIYIVLDEAMGIEGLRSVPGGNALADRLQSLFVDQGFHLFGRAFSRHFVSARSIPNILNFDFRDDSYGPLLRHSRAGRVDSALFNGLMQRGYRTVVYDTVHIDFCFDGASRCETLPSFNPFSPYMPADSLQRSAFLRQIVRYALVESYLVYYHPSWLFWGSQFPSIAELSALDAHAFPAWADRFRSDVLSSPRGRAYFAHLLMPHAPYVLDADCHETGASGVGYFLHEQRGLRGTALDTARAETYRRYVGQYRCAANKVGALLAGMDQDPAFADATIVIEGDHGARISSGQYAESLSDRDMVDNYSALYAVRKPGLAPGYDLREVSVQRLTAEFFSGKTPAALGRDEPSVVVDSRNGSVVLRPMPDFGASPTP
jgi:hypothetical protein